MGPTLPLFQSHLLKSLKTRKTLMVLHTSYTEAGGLHAGYTEAVL